MSTQQTGHSSEVNGWEDDPAPAVEISRPTPDLARQPFAYAFPHPQPSPDKYQPGTSQFRYWAAAEALRRGADFWAPLLPVQSWQPGATLKVLLDEGEDLNAFYDRNALNFFHGPGPNGTTVFSGESPDILCHEMGHAILDAVKPELWNAASQEAAAFHEGFADVSAILSALQLQSLRIAVLQETGGQLFHNSRLSRLAEQLGAAIRAQAPDAVDRDCLRNAVNSFTYAEPAELPTEAPASQLSSEPHSFSRVMSGAVFEALGGMLADTSAIPGKPTEQELARVSAEMGKMLIEAVVAAPAAPNFFAQVAAQLVRVSEAVNADYPSIFRGVFVRRSILSLEGSTSVASTPIPTAAAAAAPAHLALPGVRYGLSQSLLVQAPSQPHHFAITSGAPNGSSLQPPNALEAATAFVDDLFRQGRVDDQGLPAKGARLTHHKRKLRTHRLKAEATGVRLERLLFDCGFCCR